jgi:hypothetical protein
MGSPTGCDRGIIIGAAGTGLLIGSVEAGPNMLIRKSPAMGTPKNNRRMPENSINVANIGFILLFSPFLYSIQVITIFKLNKMFLINRGFIIDLVTLVYNYYRYNGTIVI